MTNLSDTQQDGHRTGVRTKAQTNNGDSEAVTNQASPFTNHGDSHQDDRRQAPDGDQEAGKGAGAEKRGRGRLDVMIATSTVDVFT